MQTRPLNDRCFTILEKDESTVLELRAPPEGADSGRRARALVLNHGARPDQARFAYAVWPTADPSDASKRLDSQPGRQ